MTNCGRTTCDALLLPLDESQPKCSHCEKYYHFECAGVSESRWRLKNEENRKRWICRTCEFAQHNARMSTARDKASSGKHHEAIKDLMQLVQALMSHMQQQDDQLVDIIEARLARSLQDTIREEITSSESRIIASLPSEKQICDLIEKKLPTPRMPTPSYAAALSAGLPETNSARIVNIVRKEQREQEIRANNVIFSGIDSHTPDAAKSAVESVMRELEVPTAGAISKIEIIGKTTKRTKVTLTPEARKELLDKCRLLRSKERFQTIYINRDLTAAEQQLQYQQRVALRDELRKQQETHPGKEFQIQRGKVIEKLTAITQ
jgi:predicted transcriptional regulator